MWTYATKISQLTHLTIHGIQTEFMRKSDSGLRSAERGLVEMTGYPSMRNHTNCFDLRNLRNSKPTSKQT